MDFCAVLKEVTDLEENKNVTAGEIVLLYVALFSLVFIASFIGLAEFISFIFLPALLAYTAVRIGYRHTILQCGLVMLLYSFVYGGFYEAVFLTILPGVTVGVCVRRKRTLLYTVTAAALAMLAAEMVVYLISAFQSEAQVHFLQTFSEQSAEMIKMLALPAKESAIILEMLNLYLPAILLLSVAMMSYGIVFVLRLLLVRRAPGYASRYPRFRDLSVAKSCLFVWILAWVIGFIDEGTIGVAFANLATVLSCYIMFCGFALFVYWISGVRSSMLRILLYIGLMWMFSLASPAAFILGALDALFHFRIKKRGDTQ